MHPKSITLPKKAINLTGQTFNRLTAIAPIALRDKSVMWLCRCDCGNETAVKSSALRMGHVRSCGCSRQEKRITHGMTKTPIYRVWTQIVARCTSESAISFKDYGGRGITISPAWREFENFYAHVSQLPHFGEKNFSLDRIDNDRGYEPDNVRWVTSKEQGRNRRDNHYLTHNGITLTIVEWAEKLSIDRVTLQARITTMKWDVARALTTPVQKRNKQLFHE